MKSNIKYKPKNKVQGSPLFLLLTKRLFKFSLLGTLILLGAFFIYEFNDSFELKPKLTLLYFKLSGPLPLDFDPYNRSNSRIDEFKYELLFNLTKDEQRKDFNYKVDKRDFEHFQTGNTNSKLEDIQFIPVIGSITEQELRKTLEALSNLQKNRKFVLLINAPGGSGGEILAFIELFKEKNISFDTYIPEFAGSGASFLFLAGQERIMKKNAKIMFHEAGSVQSYNNYNFYLTGSDLKFLRENDDLPENTKNLNLRSKQRAMKNGLWVAKDRESVLFDLKFIAHNWPVERTTKSVVAYIAKSLGKTEDFVRDHLIRPNEDVILTAKEALSLGIATAIVD